MSKWLKRKIKIDGMHCTSCTLLIEGELEELEGVKRAQVNYPKGELEIEFDQDKVNINAIIQKVEQLGYTPVLVNN